MYPPVLYYVILSVAKNLSPLDGDSSVANNASSHRPEAVSLRENDIGLVLHIKIQAHLQWMWPVAYSEIFGLTFVIHPLLNHLFAEDSAFGEESMVMLGPGIQAKQLMTTVHTMDTAATAAFALGLGIPAEWDGVPVYEAFGLPVIKQSVQCQ